MKRILSLILALTISFSAASSLSACNKNKDEDNKNQISGTEENKNSNQSAQEDKTYLDAILAVEDEKFKLIETNLERIDKYESTTDDDYENLVNELNLKKENQEVVSLNSADNKYTIYVEKYLGKVYYQNNETGYVLSSISKNDKNSQVNVKYLSISDLGEFADMCDTYNAVIKGNSAVLQKENSIVVNFTLDNENIKFLLPERITAKKFESELLVPMLNEFRDLMIEHCNDGVYNETFDIFKAEAYNKKGSQVTMHMNNVYYKGAINIFGVQKYVENMRDIIDSRFNRENGNLGSEAYKELDEMFWDLMDLYVSGANGYAVRNLAFYTKGSTTYENFINSYYSTDGSQISETLEPIYEFIGGDTVIKMQTARLFAKYMSKYRAASGKSDYTKEEMLADEAYCGVYFNKNAHKPTFKFECSIEYSFDANGNLCVVFHDNTKEADKAKYILKGIVLLPDFYGEFTIDKPKFATDGTVTVVTMKKTETE